MPFTRSRFSLYDDAHIDNRVGEQLAQVGQRRHRAVGKHLHGSLAIAQHDRPQVDLLDFPAHAIDAGDVADPDLILDDQEETGDDVAHQILRAEADRQPGDAGARSESA